MEPTEDSGFGSTKDYRRQDLQIIAFGGFPTKSQLSTTHHPSSSQQVYNYMLENFLKSLFLLGCLFIFMNKSLKI